MNGRKYFRNEHKNNKRLVQSIDQMVIKSVHVISEILSFITYIYNIIFSRSPENKNGFDYILS